MDPSVETHLVAASVTSVEHDYAERKQTEQKSKAPVCSDELIRLVFEAAPYAMLMVNQYGNIVMVNSQAGKHFGYSPDELLDKSVETLVPTRFRERHTDYLAEFFAAPQARRLGVGSDLFGMRKDGSEIPIEIGLNPIETRDGLLVLSSIVDITERRRVEERLRESAAVVAAANEIIKQSEERYRSIIDTALDAVVDIDAAGVITGWNPQAEAVFGWKCDEALGHTLASIIIPPAQRDAHRKGLQLFLDTGVGPVLNKRLEVTALHRDGHEFPIELAVTPIAVGNTYSFSAFIRDITERKRAEEGLREFTAALTFANESLRDVNEELRLRNVELDEFTFIASHDLQEPLRKLISFGDLLPKDLGEVLPEAAEKDLNFIIDAARRMRVLVQDLLALSRAGREAITYERVSMDRCVDRVLLDMDAEIKRTGAEITREALPDVLGDPMLLAQLYQNLIGNALKFADPDRRPEIHLTCERKDDQWIFSVRDNGIGIKAEYHEQIFAPFKRLHGRGEYEGTGIGLAICRKAVERHGGRIWVESELGKGACFKFSLKIDSESAAWIHERESRPSSSSLRTIPAIKS